MRSAESGTSDLIPSARRLTRHLHVPSLRRYWPDFLAAHRILMRDLASNSPYRKTNSPSLFATLAQLPHGARAAAWELSQS